MAEPTRRITVLPDLLRAQAAARAAAPAIIHDGERVLTYGEWEARSNAVARGLVDRGVRPGDVVGLVFTNSHVVDWAVAEFAVQKAGATTITLNPDITRGPDILDSLRMVGACGLLSTENLMPAGAPGWSAITAEFEAGRDTSPFQAPASALDVATILYTSGTDGWPKAVAVPHANLSARPDVRQRLGPALSPGVLNTGLVSQASAYLMIIAPLMPNGRPTVSITAFDPERVCGLIARMGITAAALAPNLARLIVESGAPERFDMSRLRTIWMRIAPSTPALLDDLATALPGATIYNHYSSTEAAPAVTEMRYGRDPPHTVGRPGSMTQVRVIDANGGVLTEPGAVGEICLRPDYRACRWYFRDPGQTAEWFPEGFARMRDVGYIDEGGHVVLIDRLADAFSVEGRWVEALKAEGVIAEHPAVIEAAVVGVRPEGGDTAPVTVAAVVSRTAVSEKELLAFAAARMPASDVPCIVRFYDVLPRHPAGKVNKVALRVDLAATVRSQPQVFLE